MEIHQQVLLAYLEEDNTQRAYFRVRFLLSRSGPVAPEDIAKYPDDGCLRIVPDKREHNTFKDRMRKLGHLCTVDLTTFSPEANKIRTNKNYSPANGETNQFVIYSDVIHALPEDSVFEVLTCPGLADAQEIGIKSTTPRFIAKVGESTFGPIPRGECGENASEYEMQADYMHQSAFPDGSVHLYYLSGELTAPSSNLEPTEQLSSTPQPTPEVPAFTAPVPPAMPAKDEADAESEEAPEEALEEADLAEPADDPVAQVQEAPKTSEEPLEIGKRLTILDETKDFDEQLQGIADRPLSETANRLHDTSSAFTEPGAAAPQKLSGTPLYSVRTPRAQSVRTRASLSGVVDAQIKAARTLEISPTLPQGTDLHHVDNPMDALRSALKGAWLLDDMRPQAVDAVLALEGSRTLLDKAMNKNLVDSPLTAGARRLLDSLEAERLSMLVQLDKAKEDLATFRQDTLKNMTAEEKKQQADLSAHLDTLKKAVEETQKQLKEAVEERNRALKQTMLGSGPVHLAALAGNKLSEAEVLARLSSAARQAGVQVSDADCVNLAILLGMCERIGFVGLQASEACALARITAQALGVEGSFAIREDEQVSIAVTGLSVEAAPVIVASPYQTAICDPSIRLLLVLPTEGALANSMAYQLDPWAIINVDALPILKNAPMAATNCLPPVCTESLSAFTVAKEDLNPEAEGWLAQLLEQVKEAGTKLSLVHTARMRAYLAAACERMPGGFTDAADYLISGWLLPVASANPRALRLLLDKSDLLPRTARQIKKIRNA